MKRTCLLSFTLLLFSIMTFGQVSSDRGLHDRRLDAQTGPVAGKPLSGTQISSLTKTLADGTHVVQNDSSKFFRDAQGRTRVESTSLAVIYDPVAHATYHLDFRRKICQEIPFDESAQTYSITASSSHTSTSSSNNETTSSTSHQRSYTTTHTQTENPRGPVTEDLPAQVINGIPVKGTRVTQLIPQGAIGNERELKVISERWYSDDLKILVKSVSNHPVTGVSTYELTNIVQGPPDPALFRPPADFEFRKDPRPSKAR